MKIPAEASFVLKTQQEQGNGIQLLVDAQQRIALALERIAAALTKSLGERQIPGYPDDERPSGLIAEQEMAALLDRSPRTLAKYRRAGKLPGCWVRNGRTTLWKKEATLGAWQEGLS